VPESGLFTIDARLLAGVRNVDAGESTADDIDWLQVVCADLAHVVVPGHVRPVLRQHGTRPWIDLDLPADVVAGPLEAKVEAADAGEQ
jgi:hypothetical protein